MGRVVEPAPISAPPSNADGRTDPVADPPAEDAAPARLLEWRDAATAVAVVLGTEVLLTAALAMGVRALGR